MGRYDNYGDYDAWVLGHDSLSESERTFIREDIRRLSRLPLFSILVLPGQGQSLAAAHDLIASLEGQMYPHWELLLPTGKDVSISTNNRLRQIIVVDQEAPDLLHLVSIAANLAEGEFLLPVPVDAILRPNALYEFAKAINADSHASIIYTDEDCIAQDGKRSSPVFKTGWDPDLALASNSFGLLVAYQVKLLESVGRIQVHSTDPSLALYALSLHLGFTAEPKHIHHLPRVLCHRAKNTSVTVQFDAEGARAILRQYLASQDLKASVIAAPLDSEQTWVVRDLPSQCPLVSVIIPTRDRAGLLERCVQSILDNTRYPLFEVIIIDNDSREEETATLFARLSTHARVRILKSPGPFNYAKLNNFAALDAKGEILVLLNNDTATIDSNWMDELVVHALRPDVGAVGAKLIYENGQVQHAGMVFQPGIGPVHQFRFAERAEPGPGGALALTRSVMMVTGACLALRRSLYIEAGGLDECLSVAYNDIDLCMRLGDLGYRIVWTPRAELFHFEGMSRGYDDTPEKRETATREHTYFTRRWGSLMHRDPFRNDNIDYHWDSVLLSQRTRSLYFGL
ncbi:GT2 family glycosyltransferase [Paraburkholderia sp. GAS206C]|uniref:glycosyltransferase family 2 protein n=1 Tax=unclassified Paraburkholderia TaxID=2615204 RepID=UPI003D22722D